MKKHTIDDIMRLRRWARYTRKRVQELWSGRDGLTLREICDLEIPPLNKIWAAAELAGRRLRMRLGRAYAGRVLHLWEARYPEDSRVSDCLAAIDRWLKGQASDDELRAATWAAAAAANAAVVAARAADEADAASVRAAAKAARAADEAARGLAGGAATSTRSAAAIDAEAEAADAWDAVQAAERDWQLEETKRLLEEYGDDDA